MLQIREDELKEIIDRCLICKPEHEHECSYCEELGFRYYNFSEEKWKKIVNKYKMDYKFKDDWDWEGFKDYYEGIQNRLWEGAPKFDDIFEEDRNCHCFKDEDGSLSKGWR